MRPISPSPLAADYVVPFRCAKCHSATGLPEFIQAGGTVVVDGKGTTLTAGIGPQHSANGFMCSTCHNEEKFPERYAIASVVFPSGKTVSFGGKDADGAFIADDSNLCILCHQGRESTLSVNNALTGKEEDTRRQGDQLQEHPLPGRGRYAVRRRRRRCLSVRQEGIRRPEPAPGRQVHGLPRCPHLGSQGRMLQGLPRRQEA